MRRDSGKIIGMESFTRREFVGAAGAVTVANARSHAQIAGAGERIRIGVIGCGGMAMDHMKALVKMREAENLEIVAVCDLFDKRAQPAGAQGAHVVVPSRVARRARVDRCRTTASCRSRAGGGRSASRPRASSAA